MPDEVKDAETFNVTLPADLRLWGHLTRPGGQQVLVTRDAIVGSVAPAVAPVLSGMTEAAAASATEAAADAALTAADRVATAADRVQTGIDAAAAAAAAIAAAAANTGTSTTLLAVGTGSKSVSTQAGKQWSTGQWLILVSTGTPTEYMIGQVTSYSGTSLTLSVPTAGAVGSGTHADWGIAVSGPVGATGASYAGTSSSSVAIGSGSKAFTTQSGLAYAAGTRVRVANSATDYMEGVVSSYSSTTLAVSVDRVVGSGTFTSWTIGIAGDPGAGAVDSVNGKTGVVALTAVDVAPEISRLNLFPDPYFDISAGDGSAKSAGKAIYNPAFNNRTWVPDYTHSMGVGAWLSSASSATLIGFDTHFELTVKTDDEVALGVIVKAGAGTAMSFGARFFAGSTSTFVGGQFGLQTLIATGGEDLVTVGLTAVPAGATGVCLYFSDGSPAGDIYVLAHWVTLNALAGVRPPARMAPVASAYRSRMQLPLASAAAEGAIKVETVVAGAASNVVTATLTSATARTAEFCGWADTYVTPGSISFNAVKLVEMIRGVGTPAWSRVRVAIRTHATAPAGSGATLVAIGDAYIDPDALITTPVTVLLRDPLTRALKTVTEADLLAQFSVAYYAYQPDGTPAICGELLGTVSGITRAGASFYLLATHDPTFSAYMVFSGNPSLAIGLQLITSPTETMSIGARTALATSLGITPAGGLTAPTPNDPVLAPRTYGMIGLEMSLYLDCLRSGRTPRMYDVASSYGAQQDERWTWTPGSTLDGGSLAVTVYDADNIATSLGTATTSLDVASATAAAGASKRVLCLGDSTTAAALYTARVLALAAANSSAVQPTLLGTLGSGSNKHEGRGGWTMANYFSAAAPGGVTNPFYNSGTSRFDMAYYLSNTGQAAPHAVLIHLGINDVFGATSDAAVNSIMDTFVDQLSRIIGLTADAAVGSILEASASTVTVIALPIPPSTYQSAFGYDYGAGQTLARYRRNIVLAAYRIKAAFSGLEASNVYLLGWNASVDPAHGFPTVSEAANAQSSDNVTRGTNSVHPNTSGYNQMGDALFACLNWLTVKGKI